MKRIFVLILLFIPAMAFSSETKNTNSEEYEYVDESDAITEAVGSTKNAGSTESVKRPDAQKMLSELSSALKLSSKQEHKITVVINEWVVRFDGLMKEYNKAQEKEELDTIQAKQDEMKKLNRDMLIAISKILDDEQRQAYDGILEANNNSARAAKREAEEEENKVAEEKRVQEEKKEEKVAEIAAKKKERKDKETLRKVREKYGQPTFEIMEEFVREKDTFMIMIAVNMVRDSVTGNATRQTRNVCIALNSETMDCRCGEGKSQKFVKEAPYLRYGNAIYRVYICEPGPTPGIINGETKPRPKRHHQAPTGNEL